MLLCALPGVTVTPVSVGTDETSTLLLVSADVAGLRVDCRWFAAAGPTADAADAAAGVVCLLGCWCCISVVKRAAPPAAARQHAAVR